MHAEIDWCYGEFSELDERFHRLIHAASHNRFIVDFFDVIARVFPIALPVEQDERARNGAACRGHMDSARRTLIESVPDGI